MMIIYIVSIIAVVGTSFGTDTDDRWGLAGSGWRSDSWH